MYKDKDLRKPAQGDWDDKERTKTHKFQYDSIYGTDDPNLQHDAMAGYYASITHVDHQIGRILLALQEDGILEDTIVCFVSDHGEMLFDHGLWRKVFPYQGSVHIPFLMRVGKNITSIPSNTFKEVVELRDVMPTLLDFCGISIPNTVDGISLKPLLEQKTNFIRDYLHGEHSFHSNLSNHYIVTKQYKYIWYSQTGIEQFFDLENDPWERHNLIQNKKYQETINVLRNHLIFELKNRPEGYSDGTKLYIKKEPRTMIPYKN